MTKLFNDDDYTGGILGNSPESALIDVTPTAGAGPGLGLDAATGIGVAAPAMPRDLVSREIARMSPADKVFAAMGEFGAGLRGRPSPLLAQVEQQRKEKLLQMEELKGGVSALEHGVKLLEGLTGDDRTKFSKSYGARLNDTQEGLGDTFMAIADKPDTAQALMKHADKIPELKMAYEAGGFAGVRKLLQSPEFMGKVQTRLDGVQLPNILRKGQTFVMGWQQIVPEEMAAEFNKDGRLTASELIRANEWIKTNKPDMAKVLALTDDEIGVISRNAESFYGPLGILSPKDEADVIKDKAKDSGKPPPSRDMRRGTKIIKQEFREGKWVDVGEGEAFKPKGPNDVTASQERTNAEIDAARLKIEALSDDDIKRLTSKTSNTGRENPNYDPLVARDVSLATRKKYGDDPEHEQITKRIAGKREAAANEQSEYERAVQALTEQLNDPSVTSKMKRDIQGRLDKAHSLARQKGLKLKKP